MERNRFRPQSASTPSTKRASELSTQTQCPWPPVPAWERMWRKTHSTLCSVRSWIWLSLIKMSTWPWDSVTWEWLERIFLSHSSRIWFSRFILLNLSTKWWGKNHQFQLFGRPPTIRSGACQPWDPWSRSQTTKWLKPSMKRPQLSKSCPWTCRPQADSASRNCEPQTRIINGEHSNCIEER